MALSFGITSAPLVRAEPLDDSSGGRFVLDIRQCSKPLTDGTRRFIGIEVGDLLYEDTATPHAGADTLTIRCTGSLAWIEAAGKTDAAPLEKIFNLDDFPGDAAPRALALASLELMAAQSSTVRERIDGNRNATPSPPEPAKVKSPPPVPVVPRAAPEKPVIAKTELRLGLAGLVRTFPSNHGPTLWGGHLRLDAVFDRFWRLAADIDATTGQNEVSVGRTRALLFTSGATWGIQGRIGILETGFGFGGRLGAVRLSGSSADPARVSADSVWRPWGGPMAAAGLSCSLDAVAFSLMTEAGLSLLKPEGQADTMTAIALGGPWAAVALGASIRL